MYKLLRTILAAILVSGLVLSGCSSGKAPAPAQGSGEGYNVGNLAPDFQLRNLDGQAVSLRQFRGRPVLLNFWASWCGPCREEMPLIQQIFEDRVLAGKGLVVLGIDLGEDSATVANFMKNNGFSFPVLLDTKRNVAEEYNIRAIPTTFFVDKNGIIKDIRIGAFPNKSQIIVGLGKIIS